MRPTRMIVATGLLAALSLQVAPASARKPSPTVAELTHGYADYVGSLHEHSGYSDGWVGSTPATFYAAGKKQGLDFVGGSDHSDFLGVPLSTSGYCTPDPTNPTGRDPVAQVQDTLQCPGGDPSDETKALTKWQATKDYAAAASTKDFTAFQGFEWTSDIYGHLNGYFSTNYANAKVDGYPTPKTFYDWLTLRPELGGGADAIFTFNHPGAKDQLKAVRQGAGLPDSTSLNWNDFAYDPRVDDQAVGLETYNDVQEYGSTRDTNLYPEGYYAHVLDKGWHVGAVGAEDLGHRRSDDWGGPSWAKTVILSTNRDPAALKAALLARRFYAVRSGALRLGLTVDDALMGSRLTRATGDRLHVAAAAAWPGTSGLTLQLVTSHGVVVATGTDSLRAELVAAPDQKYYFLRVLRGSSPMGYSSPVWVSAAASSHVGDGPAATDDDEHDRPGVGGPAVMSRRDRTR